jgi:hypothetical protein
MAPTKHWAWKFSISPAKRSRKAAGGMAFANLESGLPGSRKRWR